MLPRPARAGARATSRFRSCTTRRCLTRTRARASTGACVPPRPALHTAAAVFVFPVRVLRGVQLGGERRLTLTPVLRVDTASRSSRSSATSRACRRRCEHRPPLCPPARALTSTLQRVHGQRAPPPSSPRYALTVVPPSRHPRPLPPAYARAERRPVHVQHNDARVVLHFRCAPPPSFPPSHPRQALTRAVLIAIHTDDSAAT